jgi:hypothetical protein
VSKIKGPKCAHCTFYAFASSTPTTSTDGLDYLAEEWGECRRNPPIPQATADFEDLTMPHGWHFPQVWPIEYCSKFKFDVKAAEQYMRRQP